MNGLIAHLLLTLRLNFRSRLPIIYGYLVPILFLVGFAAVFRDLKTETGALLTITTLGGACFGLPTAMVAERERGIWRRYKLLPMATGAIVLSTLAARLLLVVSASVMQIVLAVVFYHMPWPDHPGQLAVAYLFVAWAFLALGLVIAALADTVPAVQALGQAIFLPMILIGGVGVPLNVLPRWANIVAQFTPGVYSVQAMDACVAGNGLRTEWVSLEALLVFGLMACAIGVRMFRWDTGRNLRVTPRGWVGNGAGVVAWCAFVLLIFSTSRTRTSPPPMPIALPAPYRAISQQQIDSITYDDLQDDNSFVTPVVDSFDGLDPKIAQWVSGTQPKVAAWPPGKIADPVQRVRNLLSLAAIADLDQDPHEGEWAHIVFAVARSRFERKTLEQILAYIILNPSAGTVQTSAAELGLVAAPQENDVRDRSRQYAKKLLGRLLGKLG